MTIPKFFIPGIPTEKTDAVFDGAIEYSRKMGTKATGVKIFKLFFEHKGKKLEAEIGKPHPHYPDESGSVVKLIIEQRSPALYDVQASPQPFLVGKHDVQHVIYFSIDETHES